MSIEQGTLAELNVKPGDVVDCITVDSGEEYDGINPHYIRDGRYGVAAYDDDGAYFMMGSPSIFRIVSRASDTPTAWKDMTDAEKGALLLARENGAVLQFFHQQGHWLDRRIGDNEPLGQTVAYRVKPDPVVETVTLTGYMGRGYFHVTATPMDTHRITFDTIDGVPDCSTVKMEAIE